MIDPTLAGADPAAESDDPHETNVAAPRSPLHNTFATVITASIAPIISLLYIDHYAVNAFFFDDYSTFIAMNMLLHSHQPYGQLWLQYTEGRQVMSNIIFMLSARIDRANVRSILLFSGVVFIATYVIVLALFQKYLRTYLTPIPVLLVGVVWFSIGDVGNSLFAYQLSLYFVVFFVFVMLFALLNPEQRKKFWFAVAVVAAVASSLSFLDGFLAWPLGAICIVWRQPWGRRTRTELAVWIVALSVTSALYFIGYQSSGCAPIESCSVGNSLSHPVTMIRVLLALIGGVLPGGYFNGPIHSSLRFELIGAVLLAVAVFIIIQSWRNRSDRESMPLPMLMILLALSWDAMIAVGRTGLGVNYIAGINRYMLPNLILLTAIVMYAWAHRPLRSPSNANAGSRNYLAWLPMSLLVIFVIVQVSWSTSFGLSNGRAAHNMFTTEARLWVNLDRIPVRYRKCEVKLVLNTGLFDGGPPIEPANDHLGEFGPTSYHYFRALGPPPLSPRCVG